MWSISLLLLPKNRKWECNRATFGSVNKKLYRFCFLRWKSCTFARFKIWQCTGEVFPHLLIFLLLSEQHLAMSKKFIFGTWNRLLFGDAVGASLVRGPWLPPRGCYVMCDVAVCSWFEQHDSRECCFTKMSSLQKLELWSLFRGAMGGCRVCHVHLSQLRGRRLRLDGFYFHLSQRRVCFLDLKKQEKLETQIWTCPVQDSCRGCCLC